MIRSPSRLNVLLICEPGCDGVYRHVEGLIRFLRTIDCRVGLVYSSVRSSDRHRQLIHELNAQQQLTLDLGVGNRPTWQDLRAVSRVCQVLRQEPYDIVHCHSAKAGWVGRIAAAICRVPCVYTPQAYFGMGRRRGWMSPLVDGAEAILGRWFTTQTINVSSDEMEFAIDHLRLDPSRHTVIPNGVDFDRLRPADPIQKAALRREWGLPAAARILGTVGRLDYQKDPQLLYGAFARVAAEHPDLFLLHLGDGVLAPEIDQLLDSHDMRSRTKRIPYLADPTPFYKALDAFILTSRYEGLSFAVLEALATDLPIILTSTPGNRCFESWELPHAWFAQTASEPAVASKIREWLECQGRLAGNREPLQRLAELGQCHQRVLQVYQRILAPTLD